MSRSTYVNELLAQLDILYHLKYLILLPGVDIIIFRRKITLYILYLKDMYLKLDIFIKSCIAL